MAEDKILFKYEVDTTALDVKLKKVEKELLGVETASKKTSTEIQKGAKKSAQELNKVDKNVKGLGDSMSTLANNLPFAGQAQQLLQMGGALKGMTGATGGATSAMKILKVALASTGIGLLVVALAGLVSYFKKSDQGATFFSGVMTGLEKIFDRIMQPITAFGKGLVDVAQGTKELGSLFDGLGTAIKENLMNRITAGSTALEALSLAMDGNFKQAGLKILDATTQFATGIKDITKKTKDFIEEVSQDVLDGIDFEKRLDANEDAFRDLGVEAQKVANKITELFLQSKNKGVEAEKRQQLLVKALKLEEDITDKQIKLQKQKNELIREETIRKSVIIDKSLLDAKNQQALAKDEVAFKRQLMGLDKTRFETNDEQADKLADGEKALLALLDQRTKRTEKAINFIANLNAQRLGEINDREKAAQDKSNQILQQGLIDNNLTEEEFNIKSIENIIESAKRKEDAFAGSLDAQQKDAKSFFDQGLLSEDAYYSQLKTIAEDNGKLISAAVDERQKAQIALAKLNHTTSLKQEDEYYKIQQQNIVDESEISKQLLISTQLDQINAGTLTQKEAAKQSLEQDKGDIQRKLGLAILAHQDTLALEKELLKKENEIKKAAYDEDVENKKKADEEKKQIIVAGLNLIADVASELASRGFEARKEQIDNELRLTQERADKETAINQDQLDRGIISQNQFDARQERLDKKKRDAEATAKRKQFEADKEAAIVQATISSLLAFVVSLASAPLPGSLIPAGIALATGLVQVALIASKPTPKFAKGGIIDGKSHTQGGVHIEAEGGEYIINKNQTSKNKGVLDAINKGMFDKYVHNNYILPSLKSNIINARENSSNVNNKLLESLVMNGMIDTSNLERITKRNKTVSIDNGIEIASTIASKINSKSYVK